MTKKTKAKKTGENRIIAALSAEEKRRLLPQLEKVSLKRRDLLIKADEPFDSVYFPLTAVISVVSKVNGGPIVEIATIGNEGILGIPVFLGARKMPAEAFCQVSGMALKLSTASFIRHLNTNAVGMQRALRLYTQALLNQIGQSVVCNRVHEVEQRCCRWLLMTHDRVVSDCIELTQQFLAQMLGVRRASVNEVAKSLQKAGLIRYHMGTIEILDRKGLERTACECYHLVRTELNRLDPRKSR